MSQAAETIWIKDIAPGRPVAAEFMLSDLRLGQTKTGKPFVGLKLMDKTGRIEARVWTGAEAFFNTFKNGDVALIQGTSESFNNQVQIKIERATPVAADQIDEDRFLAASDHDPDRMLAELTGLIDDMADPHLRGLLQDFFADPDFTAAFVRAPAAKRFHHAYMAGLLEHTLSVARAAGAVSALYPDLDRDLLLAGAVLHDVGKIKEYGLDLAGDFTDAGRLVGHLVMGVEMVAERVAARPDFPEQTALLLKHLLLSHHGEYELGSPKRPKILEALALNLIDDLDAKMNGLGGFIERHADPETGWTDFNRLMDRYFYRPPRAGTEAEVEVEAEPAGRMEEPEAAVEAGGGGDGSQPQPPAPEAESTEVDRRDRDQLSFLNE